ncbi:hypothetical protein CC78DRAFT_615509 [Lojkania enalia]|uniref:Uncharacterized protein n=1 Tax=Lojkania enalia TaxID=147567 RepID=A0A9P4N1D7_9PLEO|nr:hypothetical protein CC78DRAFT_615509 [Didymosphaeria enalia]
MSGVEGETQVCAPPEPKRERERPGLNMQEPFQRPRREHQANAQPQKSFHHLPPPARCFASLFVVILHAPVHYTYRGTDLLYYIYVGTWSSMPCDRFASVRLHTAMLIHTRPAPGLSEGRDVTHRRHSTEKASPTDRLSCDYRAGLASSPITKRARVGLYLTIFGQTLRHLFASDRGANDYWASFVLRCWVLFLEANRWALPSRLTYLWRVTNNTSREWAADSRVPLPLKHTSSGASVSELEMTARREGVAELHI